MAPAPEDTVAAESASPGAGSSAVAGEEEAGEAVASTDVVTHDPVTQIGEGGEAPEGESAAPARAEGGEATEGESAAPASAEGGEVIEETLSPAQASPRLIILED